jgi:two-component system, chemotaxis family, protein-glutamate methylesterase/glutaminase
MNKAGSQRRDIIVIGGSSGAFEALRVLVSLLPAELDASLFVTLHIPNEFPSSLPLLLRSAGPLSAFHPKDAEPIRAGTIYVAPPDFHLLIDQGKVRLSRGPRENRHRPAVDPMFRSAARAYGSRVAGLILSGQLDDGAAGLLAVKMAGGLTVAQDPGEALCPEMPSRSIEYAGVDHILPVREIAPLLIEASTMCVPAAPSGTDSSIGNGMEQDNGNGKISSASQRNGPSGEPSAFSCPECHGVLWEVEQGKLLRFQCRVGHAFTADALRVALSDSAEDALWAAMRVLEERAALLRRMASRSRGQTAARYHDEAGGYAKHATTIRNILVETQNWIERRQAGTEEEPPLSRL